MTADVLSICSDEVDWGSDEWNWSIERKTARVTRIRWRGWEIMQGMKKEAVAAYARDKKGWHFNEGLSEWQKRRRLVIWETHREEWSWKEEKVEIKIPLMWAIDRKERRISLFDFETNHFETYPCLFDSSVYISICDCTTIRVACSMARRTTLKTHRFISFSTFSSVMIPGSENRHLMNDPMQQPIKMNAFGLW